MLRNARRFESAIDCTYRWNRFLPLIIRAKFVPLVLLDVWLSIKFFFFNFSHEYSRFLVKSLKS